MNEISIAHALYVTNVYFNLKDYRSALKISAYELISVEKFHYFIKE